MKGCENSTWLGGLGVQTPPTSHGWGQGGPSEHPWGEQPFHRSAVPMCTGEELSLLKKPHGCLWIENLDYSSSEISNF